MSTTGAIARIIRLREDHRICISYEAHIDMLQDLDPKLKFVDGRGDQVAFKVSCRPLNRKRDLPTPMFVLS